MPFSLKRITQPSHEPISLTEAKDFLRVDYSDQDSVIDRLITTARVEAETYLRRVMVNSQFKMTFDRFPGSWPFSYGFGSSLLSPYREIHIPICPLVSVDSFQMIDMVTGGLVDVDYQISDSSEPARVQPPYGQAWPIARWVLDAGQLTFTAGYGDTTASPAVGEDPPEVFTTAMLLMIGHWYENRESQVMPDAAKNLLQPYRVWDMAPVMNNWERWAR